MISSQQLDLAIQAIDKANQNDPNTVTLKGQDIACELIYGQRMSQCLKNFEAEPSAELQIAARAQHIQRWQLKRSEFPMDRAGYYKWRIQLGRFHAEKTTEILQQLAVSSKSIEQVQSLLQKENLKQDPEMQTLEDVICLVFLEFYFGPFAEKHPEQKIISIVQKTWAKMSDKGHSAALQLPEHLLSLVKKALS